MPNSSWCPRKSRELDYREGQKADTLSIQVGGFGRYAGLIRTIFFIIGLLADVILPAVLDAPGPWLHEDPAPQGRCVEVTPRASKKPFQLDLAPGGQLDWKADEPTSP